MTPLYTKSIAWIDAITPAGVTVYVRDQNAPAPASPRIALRIAATTETAHWRGGINDDDQQDVIRWIGFTLSMQVYGTDVLEAENIAAQIMDMAYFSELRVDHMGRNVAFNRVISGPQTINATIGSRIEPRVTLDLQMSAARDLVYDVGPIEEVEMAGTLFDGLRLQTGQLLWNGDPLLWNGDPLVITAGDVSGISSEAVASIKTVTP